MTDNKLIKGKKSYCTPILLKGHERPITSTIFNPEGDLLFTSSKGDRESIKATVWKSQNGERLGTYKGHTGSISSLDVDYNSRRLLSSASDNDCMIFDVETGVQIHRFEHKTVVSIAQWATGSDHIFMSITARLMNENSSIFLYDARSGDKPTKTIVPKAQPKTSTGRWGPLNKTILMASEDGVLRSFDANKGELLKTIPAHQKTITDVKFVRDDFFLLSSSKDGTCKLWDADSFDLLKTYSTGRPINSADLSPVKDEVITGGGQDASIVTTTRSDPNQFRPKFFHMVYTDFIGIFGAGHFSPVNCIRYSPNGKSFVTGGEDGYVRLHHFDQNYFDYWGFDMYSTIEGKE